MSTEILAHPPSSNGRAVATPAPFLVSTIDRLGLVRAELKRLKAEDLMLTGRVVAAMQEAGVERANALTATAVLSSRTTLAVDPELFHQAVGTAAYSAMTVSVEAARTFMGEADLRGIAEATTTTVLRVEAREGGR